MNTITVTGRLGKDPEQKTFGNTTTAKFSIASDVYERGEKKTLWFNATAFGRNVEQIMNQLTKGTLVTVSGELTIYERDGKTSLNVSVNQWQKLSSGVSDGQPRASQHHVEPATNDDYDPFADE